MRRPKFFATFDLKCEGFSEAHWVCADFETQGDFEDKRSTKESVLQALTEGERI